MNVVLRIAVAAFAGNAAITIYLVIERAVAQHLPLATCLRQLLQWDASNAYGVDAFSGGWPIAGVGFLMDLVVSAVWAAIFLWLFTAVPSVRYRTWAFGLAFGVVVMGVMLFGIVPLGHATRVSTSTLALINVLVAHTIFFGLPVALVVKGLRFAN